MGLFSWWKRYRNRKQKTKLTRETAIAQNKDLIRNMIGPNRAPSTVAHYATPPKKEESKKNYYQEESPDTLDTTLAALSIAVDVINAFDSSSSNDSGSSCSDTSSDFSSGGGDFGGGGASGDW